MEYTLTMYHHRAESPANEPGDYYRKPDEDRYGYVHADHLDGDKITYIEQACENNGNMIITCNGRSYRATMVTPHRYKRWQGVIFVGMSMPDAYQLKCLTCQFSIQVKVDFELKYSYFDHLHKAVNLLSCSTLQRLFPSSANCFSAPQTNPELFLSKKYQEFLTLDFGQLRALDKIVYAEPKAPVIVAGSFGTGKTQMLAQAAFQIFIAKRDENMRPRVLVCAHHQASANSFLTNYFVPMKEKNEWKASFVRMMPRNRIEQMKERYKPYCRTAFQVAKRLDKIGLVVSTFGTTLQLAEELERNGTLGTDWFTHILIDEGAQTREPETITPLSLCGENTAIAIAGDHKQVCYFLGKPNFKHEISQNLLLLLILLLLFSPRLVQQCWCSVKTHLSMVWVSLYWSVFTLSTMLSRVLMLRTIVPLSSLTIAVTALFSLYPLISSITLLSLLIRWQSSKLSCIQTPPSPSTLSAPVLMTALLR